MLVFPEAFMAILGSVPQTPRPLKAFDQDRTKKLLSLAQILLEAHPNDGRSVQYLIRITQRDSRQYLHSTGYVHIPQLSLMNL